MEDMEIAEATESYMDRVIRLICDHGDEAKLVITQMPDDPWIGPTPRYRAVAIIDGIEVLRLYQRADGKWWHMGSYPEAFETPGQALDSMHRKYCDQ